MQLGDLILRHSSLLIILTCFQRLPCLHSLLSLNILSLAIDILPVSALTHNYFPRNQFKLLLNCARLLSLKI